MMSRTIRHSRLASSGRIDRSTIYGFFMLLPIPGEQLLKMFAEAYQDFEAAWLDGKRSDAALAMGNCKVMMGEFEDALTRYLDGVTAEPEKGAKACLANSNRTNELLEALYGRDYRVSHDEFTVLVETDDLQRGVFPYTGNSGNTGNIPSGMVTAHGGKGYKGAKGFAVVVGMPASGHGSHPNSSD